MKTLLIVILLSSIARADVCYLFERGSSSWQDCKEQAMENQKRWDDLKADRDRTDSQMAASQAAEIQSEQLAILLRAILANTQNGNQ